MPRIALLAIAAGLLAVVVAVAHSNASPSLAGAESNAVRPKGPAPVLEYADYNPRAAARAAATWRARAGAYARREAEAQAANPDRPMLIASRPVPDTSANRARYGQPMSLAGQRTAPIGD